MTWEYDSRRIFQVCGVRGEDGVVPKVLKGLLHASQVACAIVDDNDRFHQTMLAGQTRRKDVVKGLFHCEVIDRSGWFEFALSEALGNRDLTLALAYS